MSRPKAANGDALSDGGWSIYDAEAFHVNASAKWHRVASFPTGVTVRGKCGVMAHTVETDTRSTRCATWANGFDGTECPTCKAVSA
jgi:hypothetical protein